MNVSDRQEFHLDAALQDTNVFVNYEPDVSNTVLYRLTKTSIDPQLNSPTAQIRTNQTRILDLFSW